MLPHSFLVEMARDYGLSPQQQEVFLLLFAEHLSYEEASSQLNISMSACVKRMGEVYKKFGISGSGRGKSGQLLNFLNDQFQRYGVSATSDSQTLNRSDWGNNNRSTDQETALQQPTVSLTRHENIPHSGVVQFVGRSQELKRLHKLLQQQDRLSITAIVGMGGIGKTELAIQYAWQHLQGLADGSGGVCWIDARDGDVGIQLLSFARTLLNLNPPEDWDLPTQLKYCWRNWQPGDWLIVIDDVTDYRQQVKPYLPPESSPFKVLLTTREELGRPLENLRLDELQPEEALELLKSLIGTERIQQESEIAAQICDWLGYLPLGLELEGRYLERDPDLSLKAMLSLLEKKRLEHRSVLEADSTMTARLGVADAFELSWERLDENAQQLACLLSLFASANIPWDLVKLAYGNLLSLADKVNDLDILEEARGDLLRCNLLQRTGEETYRLHQLIREFLREKLEQSTQADAQKQAFCQTMVKVAEQIPDLPTRQMVESLTAAIPHVAEAATVLTDYLSDEDLMKSFVGLGRFYEGQGFYDLAEPWYEQCLSVSQTRLSADPRRTATSLINLAHLYASQGRYSEAEALFLQGLELSETLGDNYSVARSLNNLASLYQAQARYNEAEPLSLQALKLSQQLGDNYCVAQSLNNLASFYQAQARYNEAESLSLQALNLSQQLGDNYSVAQSLNNLASLYQAQARYNEAEHLYRQALEIYHRTVGDDHPYMAQSLNNLASLYQALERYNEAEHLYRQALEIYKRVLGADHPGSVTIRNNIEKLCSNRTAVELP